MSFEGTFTNGRIEFAEPPTMAEGTVVEVVVKKEPEQPKPTLLGLMKLAGVIKDMPADFAEEHNHHIHGTPRRKPKVEE